MPKKYKNIGERGPIGFYCIRTFFVVLIINLIIYSFPTHVLAQTTTTTPTIISPIRLHGWISGKIIDFLLTANFYFLQEKPTIIGQQSIVTDKTGNATSTLTKGVYSLTTKPLEKKDLFIPKYITVTTRNEKEPILIGQSNGHGRVFAYDTRSTSGSIFAKSKKLFSKLGIPTRLSTQKVTVATTNTTHNNVLGVKDSAPPFGSQTEVTFQVFEDLNANGIKDANEQLINSQGIELQLEKNDNSTVYSLLNGWNLIHFPLKPNTFSTAKELVEEIAREGGYVTTIATWKEGRWHEYVQRGNDIFSEDFPIEPGVAYFLRSHKTMDWLVSGTPVDPIPLKLIPGWNSIGLFLTENQTAIDVLDAINASKPTTNNQQPETVNEIDRWFSGNWQALVKRLYTPENIREYGDNFTISPEEGYMIKANDFIEITMEDQD